MRAVRKWMAVFLCSLMLLTLSGCEKGEGEVKLVLTTGFKKDEIFRIETMSCTLPEVMVYLTNTQDQYESVYGAEIWKTNLNGVTLEESIKVAAADAVEFLMKKLDLNFPDAYRLMSATCDAQISEVVDDNVTVRLHCPKLDTGIQTL